MRRVARIVALLAVGGIVLWWLFRPEVDPLPTVAGIETMEADYFDTTTRNQIKLPIPQAHWERVFATLRPTRRDNHPAKWVMLGELRITSRGGRPFIVILFDVQGEVGAFAAGETWDKRVYYRGGDSVKLKQSLRDAQIESP